jgi:hypothetical protein
MNAGALFNIATLAFLFAGYCYVAKLLAQLRHDRGDDIADGDWPHVPAEFQSSTHNRGQ